MHPALLIQDIQYCILDQISSKKTINAFARSCKAFTETALDAQWRDLDSFTRLIECMPHDLWNRDIICSRLDGVDEHTFKLCRHMLTSDWAIFQKYSHRVRSVTGPSVLGYPTFIVDESCFLGLCAPSTPVPLLPHLTSLDWSLGSDSDIFALSRLISPRLTSLTVRIHLSYRLSLEKRTASVIPLNRTSSSHEPFAVDGDKISPFHLLEQLERSIDKLQELDHISWCHLGSEATLSLARLPALTSAELVIPEEFLSFIKAFHSDSHSLTGKHTFSRMRKLRLAYPSPTFLTAFLNHFDLPLVETIHLACTDSLRGIRESFAPLVSSLSSNIIGAIHIRDIFSGSSPGQSAVPLLGFHELRPFLQFSGLQVLNLTLKCQIALDDAMLLTMADAWPHISILYLNARGPWGPGSHITLSTFNQLLQRCPKLEQAYLPIDFTPIDSPDFDLHSVADLRRTASKYSQFWFGPYKVIHPRTVARYLAAILPISASISMSSSGLEDNEKHEYRMSFIQTSRFYRDLRREANYVQDDSIHHRDMPFW